MPKYAFISKDFGGEIFKFFIKIHGFATNHRTNSLSIKS